MTDWDGPVGLVTDLLDAQMLLTMAMPTSTSAARRPWSRPPEIGWTTTVSIASACTTRSSCPVARRAGGPRHRLDYAELDLARCATTRPRHRGCDRRQHRGYRRGQGAERVVRPGHRPGEGRPPLSPGGQARRGTGLAPAPSADRGTDRAGTHLPRHRRRHGARGRVQGRHGRSVPHPAGRHLEEAWHQ